MSTASHKPDRLTESDLAQDEMGDNSLQGDDQANVRNQRHAVPDVKQKADDSVIESLKKADKDVRAKAELGKGARKDD
ncbi:hypothetical protein PZ897_04935 [Hoeflea sp. YIM 152468]|uniref:hypothetical protein n=1 Tax=Hoeflea sp. YIM 152468 TaxID=3031759 RepID=UPI0023D9D0C3|nr:hypothetical protein [Hoeflea sp. YIM 152468]MDF1607513.1 hypothetical protein [Hoeflea sp. YIM 152468]